MQNESSDTPPILDLVVELGIHRMSGLIGETANDAYRARMCVCVDHSSGMVLSFEISTQGESERSLVVRSIEKLASTLNGLPKQILSRSPKISQMLKEPLGQIGVDLVVRESLPMADAAMKAMANGPLAGKPEPALLHVKGITLDHLFAFAEAGKLFYEAKAWQLLWDDDLIEIQSPPGPKGTAFTQVLGAMRETTGLGFVASRDAHERLQAGEGLAKGTGHWNLLYYTMDELPYDDGGAWEEQNLPAAIDEDGNPACPRFCRFTLSGGMSEAKPAELIWAEGLLRALAATTEAEFDSGRWEKQVETLAGPATYRLSMPILLEQMDPQASGASARSSEPPQVMMERMLRGMQQEVKRLGRPPTQENLEEISEGINSGKINPQFDQQTPAEQAQEICYHAKSARGRRIVQLARKALEIDPDCCDAFSILAERLSVDQSEIPLLQKAVEAGERQLGDEYFEENIGHFWGLTETRPYMRAKAALAMAYLHEKLFDLGITHLQRLLKLNPGDNQGNRYTLAQALLAADRLDELDALLENPEYRDDFNPEWNYTRVLLAYRRDGDTPVVRVRLARAVDQNPLVARLLTGSLTMSRDLVSASSEARVNEAMQAVEAIGAGWIESDGAVEWLDSQIRKHAEKAETWERERRRKAKKKRR